MHAQQQYVGHEVRYAITIIKLTFLFTFQVRAVYVYLFHRQSIA